MNGPNKALESATRLNDSIAAVSAGIEAATVEVMDEWVALLKTQLDKAIQDRDRYRDALERIACLDEGPEVTPSFDSPATAAIAREALKGAS